MQITADVKSGKGRWRMVNRKLSLRSWRITPLPWLEKGWWISFGRRGRIPNTACIFHRERKNHQWKKRELIWAVDETEFREHWEGGLPSKVCTFSRNSVNVCWLTEVLNWILNASYMPGCSGASKGICIHCVYNLATLRVKVEAQDLQGNCP